MEGLLIIVATVTAVIAFLIYPLRPKCTLAASVITTILGGSALTVLVFGPKDYLLRVPSIMSTALHPWILGSFGMLMLILGVGGLIGISACLLMRKKNS